MKNEIIKFSVTDAAIKELAVKYQDMKITDTASYKLVTAGIGKIRSIRISIEKRRKELKADALEYGRRLDSEAKRITELLLPIEIELKATKGAEDDKKALAKAEEDRLEKERIESIKTKIAAFPPDISKLPQLLKMTAPEIQEIHNALSATEIDIEVYQEFTPEAIKAKTDKSKLLQEYYIARITADAEIAKQKAEAERQEQARKVQEEAFRIEHARKQKIEQDRLDKAEAQRILDEKALKKQEEEQKAKQKIEDSRLAKIREEQEIEAQKLRDAQAKIDAQKKAIQDEKDRLENERIERERIEREKIAKIEKERLAKIEAEKQEKARIEQEAKEETERKKAEAEEKKRQEALRPDQKALEFYLSTIQKNFLETKEPLMKTPAGNIVLTQIQAHIEKALNSILDFIEDM